MKPIKDESAVTGTLIVTKINKDGETVQEFEVPNMVVDEGLEHIAGRIDETFRSDATNVEVIREMSHMALGSGDNNSSANVPAEDDTTLQNERGRVPLTTRELQVNTGNPRSIKNQIKYEATFIGGVATGYAGLANAGAITEAGIFNDGSAGQMLCRTTFLPVNKEIGDTIKITWLVTIA